MTTLELIDQLLTKSENEIDYALFNLLLKGKINFIKLSNLYVQSLEHQNSDRLDQLIEAETCAIESLIWFIGKRKKNFNKGQNKVIQKILYLLNKSRRFNMKGLNERFNYNEELAKKLSWYEKNKEE